MRRRFRELLPWLPTFLAVGLLLGLFVVAADRLLPKREAAPRATVPRPTFSFGLPDTSTGPQAPISLLPSPAASPKPAPTPSRLPTPTPERTGTDSPISRKPTTAPPPTVTGAYRVVDSYGDSFIGEVAVTNTTGQKRNWTAVLSFPDGVGGLRTSWLESLPQPTLKTGGRTFTWASTVPLEPGQTGLLRFHLDRTGADRAPERCAVNGTACSN